MTNKFRAIHIAHYHSEGQTMVIVRVPKDDAALLNTVLDHGADGIIFPHVESAAEVQSLIKKTYYPPIGHRSFSPWIFPAQQGGPSLYADDPYCATQANRHVALIPQVESVKGIEAADEIAALEHVHGMMIGPTDYSFDAGVPLFESPGVLHPAIQEALGKFVAAGQKHGKPLLG
jgi:4-hydroxy-2-oxoheptanedioate aldolase